MLHMALFGGLGALPAKVLAPSILAMDPALRAKLFPPLAPGTCTADGKFIWDVTATGAGYWRRKRLGESCKAPSNFGVTVGDHRTGAGGSPGGGVTVTDPQGQQVGVALSPSDGKNGPPVPTIQVGPFAFPLVDHVSIYWSRILPQSWRDFINAQLTRDCSPCIQTSMADAGPKSIWNALRTFLGPEMPARINQDFFGLKLKLSAARALTGLNFGPLRSGYYVKTPSQPIATTIRPDTGEKWSLYAYLQAANETEAPSDTNPWMLRISWEPYRESTWEWITNVVSSIVNQIGTWTCDILSSDYGKAAIVGGAAVASGGTAAAGAAAGVNAGSQLCATPTPPSQQIVPNGAATITPITPPWVWALVAIGVGAAAYFLLIPPAPKRANTARAA